MNVTTGPTMMEGEIVVHTVTVGHVGHTFDPPALTANPGDKVMFEFYPGNHSFIQSLYGWPCIPKASVEVTEQGVYSGQFPNVQPDKPVVWNLTINDTNPIWYYCGAVGSCINYGMLGAINPANGSQVLAQQDLAKQARVVLYPGDPLSNSVATSISSLAATIFPQYNANNTYEDNGTSHHHGLSGGAIAGIVIGAIAGLAILGALFFFLGRNRRQNKNSKERANPGRTHAEQPPPARSEMVVDGVTYVPANTTGTFSSHASYLPPYGHDGHDGRLSPGLPAKSPDPTVVSFGSPMSMQQHYSGHFPPSPPPMGYQHQRSYTETSELGIHAPQPQPQPRHELPVDPSFAEHDFPDTEHGARQI